MGNARRTSRRSSTVRPRTTVAAAPAGADIEVQESAKRVDLRTEYAYVMGDLRQLGIVTGAIFALLLVVGFML